MCTLALFLGTSSDYPVIAAANRDEHYDRPGTAPMLWPGEPRGVVAGKDLRAGGTWLGVNGRGVLAAILNRRASGSTDAGTRSRGLLCLDLLRCAGADAAREFFDSHAEPYQPFTVVCADAATAWAGYNIGNRVESAALEPGLHVFGNGADLEGEPAKRQRAHALFSQAQREHGNFYRPELSWTEAFRPALSDHASADCGGDPRDAICVHGRDSGTVSSSVIIFAARPSEFLTFYTSGPPCRNSFQQAARLSIE